MRETTIKENIDRIILDVGIKTSKYWKNMLYSIPEHEIGVIKVSGDALSKKNLSQLSAEIAYLGKCLSGKDGFYLPLVIGEGGHYSKKAHNARRINGATVVSDELIELMVKDAKDETSNISKELRRHGVKSAIMPYDIIKVVPHGEESDRGRYVDTGFFGDIINIDTKPIIDAIYQNRIPIISYLGKYNDKIFKVDTSDLATELAKTLKAKKLIIVGESPFVNKGNKVISEINSEFEFKKMIQRGIIKKSFIKKGADAYELLDYMGPGNSVQITSLRYNKGEILSAGLIEEILGNGNGTKLSTPFIITSYPLKVVDKKMLKRLVNDIFRPQRKRITKDYFRYLSKKDPTVYLASKNAGGAISYHVDGCEYICKMFTHKDYEGIGIGTSIIDIIFLQKGPVTWRTNIQNTGAITFYDKIKEHYIKSGVNAFSKKIGQYKIYGIGIDSENSNKVSTLVAGIDPTIETF